MRVAVVDSGCANLGSVCNALRRLGAEVGLARCADDLVGAERILLPGVGSAAAAMRELWRLQMVEALRELRQPLLGICLGMQLLYERSDEGEVACLGLLPGRIERLPAANGVRVPHIGWNRVRIECDAPLLAGIGDGAQAYFVHGFAALGSPHAIASCRHGARFAAVVQCGRVAGVQFHPERSAAVGARLLENFLRRPPCA